MKKSNKGFTLVELIIVIAVIGVLAAILIPVFSNVIDKANAKSAYSDARNALSIYIADMSDGTGAQVVDNGAQFVVTKAGHYFMFTYQNNGLVETPNTGAHIYYDTDPHTATGSVITNAEVSNLPTNVTIYMA